MKAINGRGQGAITKLSRQANGRFLLHSAGLNQETRAILTIAGHEGLCLHRLSAARNELIVWCQGGGDKILYLGCQRQSIVACSMRIEPSFSEILQPPAAVNAA